MKAYYTSITFIFIFIISVYSASSQWTHYENFGDPEHHNTQSICIDNNDNIFVAEYGPGRYIFNGQTWTLIEDTYTTDALKSVCCDSWNNLWGASETGLWKYSGSGEPQYIDWTDFGGSMDYDYLCGLTIDKDDNIWFTSRTPYLSKFDGEQFINFNFMDITNFGYSRAYMVFDGNSTLWINCDDGILEFNINSSPDNMNYKIHTNTELGFEGKPLDIMIDNNGNVWTTNIDGDVAYYDGQTWNYVQIPDDLYPKLHPDSQDKAYIGKFGKDNFGNIYMFFLNSTYALIFNGNNFSRIDYPNTCIDHQNDLVFIKDAAEDSEGNIWVATLDNGLIKYSPTDTNVEMLGESDLIVYPNPASDYLKIQFDETAGNFDLTIWNNVGVEIINLLNCNNSTEIDVSYLSVGQYYLSVSQQGQRNTYSLIIIH